MLRSPTKPGGSTGSGIVAFTTSARSKALPSGRAGAAHEPPPKQENMPWDSSGVLGRESGAASPLADTLRLCETGVSGPYVRNQVLRHVHFMRFHDLLREEIWKGNNPATVK